MKESQPLCRSEGRSCCGSDGTDQTSCCVTGDCAAAVCCAPCTVCTASGHQDDCLLAEGGPCSCCDCEDTRVVEVKDYEQPSGASPPSSPRSKKQASGSCCTDGCAPSTSKPRNKHAKGSLCEAGCDGGCMPAPGRDRRAVRYSANTPAGCCAPVKNRRGDHYKTTGCCNGGGCSAAAAGCCAPTRSGQRYSGTESVPRIGCGASDSMLCACQCVPQQDERGGLVYEPAPREEYVPEQYTEYTPVLDRRYTATLRELPDGEEVSRSGFVWGACSIVLAMAIISWLLVMWIYGTVLVVTKTCRFCDTFRLPSSWS